MDINKQEWATLRVALENYIYDITNFLKSMNAKDLEQEDINSAKIEIKTATGLIEKLGESHG